MRPSQRSPDKYVHNVQTWEKRDTMRLVIKQFGFVDSVLWI